MHALRLSQPASHLTPDPTHPLPLPLQALAPDGQMRAPAPARPLPAPPNLIPLTHCVLLQALALDGQMRALAGRLKAETSLLVFGRGYNYATALEAALKVPG